MQLSLGVINGVATAAAKTCAVSKPGGVLKGKLTQILKNR